MEDAGKRSAPSGFRSLDSTPICHRLAHHHLASKKMSHKEDTIPEGYAYAWTLASDLSLEDFLKKARISVEILVEYQYYPCVV